MQRKKLTDADKAKREAKRAKRANADPVLASLGPTLGARVTRDDLVRTVGKATRALIATATELVESSAKTHLRVISCYTCTAPGCCNLPITMMFHEVLPVAARLRRDGRDTPELRAHLAESAELMESLSRPHYRALVRPCVFLDTAKRCSVYEDRPRECGTAFVFSPVADCSDVSISEIETVRPDAQTVIRQVYTTAKLVERSLGLVPIEGGYTGVLPRMVLWWLEAWDRTDFVDDLAAHARAANERPTSAR